MTFSTVREIVLFVLAIYAAGLSTWNLVQAIRRDRRRLGVKVRSVIPTFASGPPGRAWANIAVTNRGSRKVTVTALAFELDDRRRLISVPNDGGREGLESTRLPCTLEDGETANVCQSYYGIGHALVTHGIKGKTRITPVCEDSAVSDDELIRVSGTSRRILATIAEKAAKRKKLPPILQDRLRQRAEGAEPT